MDLPIKMRTILKDLETALDRAMMVGTPEEVMLHSGRFQGYLECLEQLYPKMEMLKYALDQVNEHEKSIFKFDLVKPALYAYNEWREIE